MRSRRGLPALLTVLVLSGCHGPTHHAAGVRSDVRTVYSFIQLTAAKPVTAPTASPKTQRLSNSTSTNTSAWNCIRRWESSGGVGNGNYSLTTGPEPFGGAYQFSIATWHGIGFSGLPSQASSAVQDRAALVEYAWALRVFGDGWEPWQSATRCHL